MRDNPGGKGDITDLWTLFAPGWHAVTRRSRGSACMGPHSWLRHANPLPARHADPSLTRRDGMPPAAILGLLYLACRETPHPNPSPRERAEGSWSTLVPASAERGISGRARDANSSPSPRKRGEGAGFGIRFYTLPLLPIFIIIRVINKGLGVFFLAADPNLVRGGVRGP